MHAIGQQGDVGTAGGQLIQQLVGGGKDHICRPSQSAFPMLGQINPLPVAVIDQGVIGEVIQQMYVDGGGGPKQKVVEAMLVQQKKRIEMIDPDTAEIEAFEENEA